MIAVEKVERQSLPEQRQRLVDSDAIADADAIPIAVSAAAQIAKYAESFAPRVVSRRRKGLCCSAAREGEKTEEISAQEQIAHVE